jgi:hypothetical protein
MPKAKAKASKVKAPAKKAVKKKAVPRSRSGQEGEGIKEFLQGVNKFLKKTKIISGVAGALSAIPGVGEIAAPVSAISGSLGYGMPKKNKSGKGLNLPGKGLNLPGKGLNLPGKGRSKMAQVPQVSPYR